MKFLDLLRMSLGNLWRRKLRTALTVLGVLIGTTSIVVMMSIGIGQKDYLTKAIAKSSELTSINVRSRAWIGPGGDTGNSKDKLLDDKAVQEILNLEHVTYVSPILELQVMALSGPYQGNFSIQGLTRERLDDMKLEFAKGSFPEEIAPGDLPLIVGPMIGHNFYNPKGGGGGMSEGSEPVVDMYENPVFLIFDTNAYYRSKYESGVPAPKKFVMKAAAVIAAPPNDQWGGPYAGSCITEMEALKHKLAAIYKGKAWPGQPATKSGRSTGRIIYSSFFVRCDDISRTKSIMEQIKGLGYEAYSQAEYIQSMQDQAKRSQLLLGGIGAISLLVAAIGIANTMMMSIYERTREIGIFKVLGCSLKNIRSLFLLEAAFIGLLGGIVGSVLSFILSFIINNFGPALNNEMTAWMGNAAGSKISIIPPWLYLTALVFATLVGMISGLMPALRAMKLSALEAIRTQ